ncbi:hypothetical protein E1292_47365 [Nonomuraea deserti]|uniref:Ankyrin repeat domain-containing protein n=1 Tax=Nonomuraea deserti TaxID=1848322 RepID=A0A4R4UJ97_9ACTN|nr:ankyrin repeat domain-containing protein [Nonomuraea deserti]TDC86849.1 hypothetical protein E1292_47365 [Nonomuraea deserti]
MSDRHFELPVHPNLDYYRKQAKRLHHAYAAGDAEAEARVADVLGYRAAERFLLSDAQFVLAQEHGFRTWAEFRAHIDSRSTTEDRPVSRLMGVSPGIYASMADALLVELRRGDPGALQRLRAYVPRHAPATSAASPATTSAAAASCAVSSAASESSSSAAATAELRDARLIIARELGFPTWQELVSFTEKSRRDLDDRREKRRQLRREAEALLAGDTDRLAGLTAEQADTLLHMLAGPETIPGVRLGKALGVPRGAVDVLLGKATNLDLPLTWAARSNRVEYVRLLLDAGADPGTRKWGVTPLEDAIYHGNTEVVDLLAGHGIVPRALWTYAACGRLDLVRACFDADGRLRPGAVSARPDLADTGAGFPSRLPATDDPAEVVGEAFVHACQHGRIEVVRWFLDRGVHPDVAPYLGRTGLHWAIPGGRLQVVRLLLERGADPSIRDDLLRADADGWLHIVFAARPHDPVTQQLHDLIESRSR